MKEFFTSRRRHTRFTNDWSSDVCSYDIDGKDISMLTLNWKRFLPNTIFLCPDGHERCSINPNGYQWFDLSNEDPKYILEESKKAEVILLKFLEEVKKKYNLNDPALNNCFKKTLGEKRYQEVIFSGLEKPSEKENTSIKGCQQNPDYAWKASLALGYNTPDYYYDIFDGNKMENCVSNPNPVFTHEITDFSKIKRLLRWGLTPEGYLKNHTYVALKNKGSTRSLEPRCQIELSGGTVKSVHETCKQAKTYLDQLKTICTKKKLGILGMGY